MPSASEDGAEQAAGEYVLGEDISFELDPGAKFTEPMGGQSSAALVKKRKRRKKKKSAAPSTGAVPSEEPNTSSINWYLSHFNNNLPDYQLQISEAQVVMHPDGRGLTIDNIHGKDEDEIASVASTALAAQFEDQTSTQGTTAPTGNQYDANSHGSLFLPPNPEELRRIETFWGKLSQDERRKLVTLDKRAISDEIKHQWFPCKCTVCAKKRHIVDEELESFYEAYYATVQNDSYTMISTTLLLNSSKPQNHAQSEVQKVQDKPPQMPQKPQQARPVPPAIPEFLDMPESPIPPSMSILHHANVNYSRLPARHRHIMQQLDIRLSSIAGSATSETGQEFIQQIKRINLSQAVALASEPGAWPEPGDDTPLPALLERQRAVAARLEREKMLAGNATSDPVRKVTSQTTTSVPVGGAESSTDQPSASNSANLVQEVQEISPTGQTLAASAIVPSAREISSPQVSARQPIPENSFKPRASQSPSKVDELNDLTHGALSTGLFSVAEDLLKNDGHYFVNLMDSLDEDDARARAWKLLKDSHDEPRGQSGEMPERYDTPTPPPALNSPSVPDVEIHYSPRQPPTSISRKKAPSGSAMSEYETDLAVFDQALSIADQISLDPGVFKVSEEGRSGIDGGPYDGSEEDDWASDTYDSVSDDKTRIEEGRHMLRIFASRMFHQRVLNAYRENVAREHQQQLLLELESLDKMNSKKQQKKEKAKEKKKDKRRESRIRRSEERDKREEEQRLKEEALKAKQEKSRLAQLEHDRQKAEAHRIEIEARLQRMKLADEAEARQKRELARERTSAPESSSAPGEKCQTISTKPQAEPEEPKLSRSAQRASAKAVKAERIAASNTAATVATLKPNSSNVASSGPGKGSGVSPPTVSKKTAAKTKGGANRAASQPPSQGSQGKQQSQGAASTHKRVQNSAPFTPSDDVRRFALPAEDGLAQLPLSMQPPHVSQTYFPTAPQFARQSMGQWAESPLTAAQVQMLNEIPSSLWSSPNQVNAATSQEDVNQLPSPYTWVSSPQPPPAPSSPPPPAQHTGGVPLTSLGPVSRGSGLARSMSPAGVSGSLASRAVAPGSGLSRLFPTPTTRTSMSQSSMFSGVTPGSPAPSTPGTDFSSKTDLPLPLVGGPSSLWGPKDVWSQTLTQADSIRNKAIQCYEQLLQEGRAVDGFVPSQVLYHSTVKALGGAQLSLNDLFQACGLNRSVSSNAAHFECLRDSVGFVTHVRCLSL